MLCVAQFLSSHDGFRADDGRYATLRGEVVQEPDHMEYNPNGQELWDPVVRKAVSGGPASFLYDSDSSFNFGDMLVVARKVDSWSTRDSLMNHGL